MPARSIAHCLKAIRAFIVQRKTNGTCSAVCFPLDYYIIDSAKIVLRLQIIFQEAIRFYLIR